jgi:hypothetical protein
MNTLDTIDKLMNDGLQVKSVYFDKDLDLMLIVLSNKQIIERTISITNRLHSATIKQLMMYTVSQAGIHWPDIGENLSLRKLLKEEIVNGKQIF